MKQVTILTLSVPIGISLTVLVLWIFGIETASPQLLASFPEGWQVYDLVKNSAALLFMFGAIRASYQVLKELWGNDTTKDQQSNDGPFNPAG